MIRALYLCILACSCNVFGLDISGSNLYLVDWNSDGNAITFNIQAKATGWIGLGLNKNGGMGGADMVVAGVRNGENYIYDMHALSNSQPVPDTKQDYVLVSASENATHTILSIRRPLDTNDLEDYPITGERLHLLWAYNTDEDVSDPQDFSQHSKKGSHPVSLTNQA